MQENIKVKPSKDFSCADAMLDKDPERPFADAKCNAHESALYMIEKDKENVGFALLGYWSSEDEVTVEVSKFFILPEHRGKGGVSIAAAKKVLSLVEAQGHDSYSLQSLNEKASHFWNKALTGRNYREDGKLFRVGDETLDESF